MHLLSVRLCVSLMLAAVPARAQPPSSSTEPTPQRTGADLPDLVRALTPTVVRVWFGEGDLITGTTISQDGLVLTCAHVPVPVGQAVQIGLWDGRKVPGTVVSKLPREGQSNIGRDLALIQITDPGPWPAAQVGTAAPGDQSTPLLAIGFPDTQLYGMDRSSGPLYVRLGHRIEDPYNISPGQIATSIDGVGGDSGGPLFDLAGRVVGVVHGGDASGAHLNHTAIEVLRRHWQDLAPDKAPPSVPPDAASDGLPGPTALPPGLQRAIVEVQSEARPVSLGCVIGPGLVLAKASELGTRLTILTHDNFVAIAEVAASDPSRDLALLRLPFAPELTQGIEPVRWSTSRTVRQGEPLTLATPAVLAPLCGIVSIEPRAIPGIAGAVPCSVEDSPDGARVKEITESIRVYRLRPIPFPLRAGDIITEIEGAAIADAAAFRSLASGAEQIGVHPWVSGEPVRISYRRGGAALQSLITLEFANTPAGQLVRPVSRRYSSFPAAFATDIPARPEHCGAPVVDARGAVVGLLIARAPFIESLVLPAREVATSLAEMMKAADHKP